MSEYTFYKLGEDPLPFPVRKERISAVFRKGQVAPDQLLAEMDAFVKEHPECESHYAEAVGALAYLLGVELGRGGRTVEALRCLTLGVKHKPDNLSLRTNIAVALQSLGKDGDALEHYEHVIADPEVGISPLIWILAARLHAKAGNYTRAYTLLDDCRDLGFDDPYFAKFLREMEERVCGRPERTSPGSAARTCSNCGRPMQGGLRFCTSCGADSDK